MLLDLENDEPIIMLQVENHTPEQDGSFRKYLFRVPPTIETAIEARMWLKIPSKYGKPVTKERFMQMKES